MLMHSSRTFVWSATACGLVVLLSFFAAVGYDFYRATIQMNEQAAMNIAALAEQTIARDIELYDLSLQSVLDGVNDPDILYQEPGLRQKILFDRSATAPGLGSLVALDEAGNFSPRKGNFADWEYFTTHHNASVGLYISKPFMASIRDGVYALQIGHGGSEHNVVTVGIGLSTAMPCSGTTKPLLLVRDADAALYRAKDGGRNTICVSTVMAANYESRASRTGQRLQSRTQLSPRLGCSIPEKF